MPPDCRSGCDIVYDQPRSVRRCSPRHAIQYRTQGGDNCVRAVTCRVDECRVVQGEVRPPPGPPKVASGRASENGVEAGVGVVPTGVGVSRPGVGGCRGLRNGSYLSQSSDGSTSPNLQVERADGEADGEADTEGWRGDGEVAGLSLGCRFCGRAGGQALTLPIDSTTR